MNDPFEDAVKRIVPITIDGKTVQVSTEAAMWLKNSLAAANDIRAFKIVAEERRSRLGSMPPPPTAAELAAEADELESKKRMAEKLVQLLQDAAARKKRGDMS